MKKLKVVLGYTAAILTMFVVLATFLGNNYFSRMLVSAAGIKVSPRYTGGEVMKVIEHGAYRTIMHRPVFDGLIGDREKGFIQIKWEATAALPPVISEPVDYDGDNSIDFVITLDTDTGEAKIIGYNPAVQAVERTYRLDKGWAVRVLLRKTS